MTITTVSITMMKNGYTYVRCPYSPHFIATAKSNMGDWDKKLHMWKFRNDLSDFEQLKNKLQKCFGYVKVSNEK